MSRLFDHLPLGSLLSFVLDNWHWLAAATLGSGGIALPFVGGLAFLKANWKWLLPTIVAVAALVWAVVAQIGWSSCSTAAAKKEAAEATARAEQAQRDGWLRGQIAADLGEANARTAGTEAKFVEVVRHVVVTKECSGTPAMRGARDGLHALGFTDQAPASGGAAPEAPAAAARPRRRVGQRTGRGAHPIRRGLSPAGEGLRRPGVLGAGEEAAVLKAAGGTL
jgi:hypothetical protein